MTTITDQMTEVGTLHFLTGRAVIYKDDSGFFYQNTGWTSNTNDEDVHVEYESEKYPSLDLLLAPFPRGIHFQREGETEGKEAYFERVKKLREPFGTWERKLQKINEERLREYGTSDYSEITTIIEARKKDGTYTPPLRQKPDPEQMIKIGSLRGQSGKGTVYQNGLDFIYLSSDWSQSEIDNGVYIDEVSDEFPTLDLLLATIPRGIEYHPEESAA